MKNVWMLLVLSLVVMLAACGESSIEPVDKENNNEEGVAEVAEAEETNNNDTSSNSEENNLSNGETEGNEEEVVEKEDLGIGATVDFNGLHVTLNGAKKYEGDGEWEVPEHHYFIIVDISIENKTDEEANISTMLQMDLVDPSGYSQSMDFMVNTRGSLDGEVGVGRTMAGEISFDAEESEFFEFIFEDPFKSGQAIWKIEASELTE